MGTALSRLAAHADPKAGAAHRFPTAWAGNFEQAPKRRRKNDAYQDGKDNSDGENSRRVPNHHTRNEQKNKSQPGISVAASR